MALAQQVLWVAFTQLSLVQQQHSVPAETVAGQIPAQAVVAVLQV
jgi:hypothetical protein